MMYEDELEAINSLVAVVNKLLSNLIPEDRVDVIAALGGDYCRHCGFEFGTTGICHCENDE